MPRKIVPKKCGCGCGETTKGGYFLPGHDSKTLSAVIETAGGITALKQIIEKSLRVKIQVKL